MQPWLRICAATAFFLWPGLVNAQTQHDDCPVRCVTIHQFFDDEIVASIPLACDRDGRDCRGAGTMRIRDEMMAVNIVGRFLPVRPSTLDPRYFGGRALSIYIHGVASDENNMTSGGTGIHMRLGAEPSQRRDFTLYWGTERRYWDTPPRMRHWENLPGQIRVIVNRYVPAPTPRVWPLPNGW